MLRVTPVSEVAARPFTIAGWQVPDMGAAVRDLAGKGVRFARQRHTSESRLRLHFNAATMRASPHAYSRAA